MKIKIKNMNQHYHNYLKILNPILKKYLLIWRIKKIVFKQ